MADQRNWRDALTPRLRERAPDDTAWAVGSADAMTPDTFAEADTPPPSAVAPSQIVFIEGSVADYQILADGVQPGVKVVILNPHANGVQQIADYLQQHDVRNLNAISIVADGADGEIQLGSTLLNASDIADYQQQLAAIGAALKSGGALLLYGCDVAQNSVGDTFLGDLATAAGVGNIAAASHVVGNAAEGGSFGLDVDLGNAAASGPFTAAAVAAYPDLLGISSNLVWYITESSTTSDTGVYTIDVDGGGAATNPTDILSTPSYSGFSTIDGLAIDPSAGAYFVANDLPTGPDGDTNQIIEGSVSSGTASVIYTSGNSGGDAIVGLAFDQLNGLLYFAVTDVNIPTSNTTTGIYTISAVGTGTRTASELVNLSSGIQAPNDIAIDATHNLLFYTDGVPGLTGVEEVGVANLTTGAIINGDLVSYSASGNVEPYGIAVNPATDTLYWTTVDFAANAGNAVYAATYSTGASVSLGTVTTLATTSQGQAPIGIALDVPANGYYVDTSTGVQNDTTADEVLFGSSLTSPEALTSVYSVPDQDGGTETLPTEAIVVEVQPTVTASGTVTFVHGDAAIAIDSTATVADADGYYLASATVSIASGLATGDTLNFTNQNGITGSLSSGTLTLTGVASAAIYQTALDSVTFSTTNATDGTPRTIDWTVSDGVVTSPTTTSTVDVHVPPAATAGATVTFDGGGSPVALDPGLTVSDPSSATLAGASVTIVSAASSDRLNFTAQHGIGGSYDTADGVLTLSGTASITDYQAALESITYSVSPTDSDPTDGGGDTSRTIDWTVNDGLLNSSVVTSTLDTVHEPPTVSAGTTTATFDGGGSAVQLDGGVTASDADSGGDLIGAAVIIGGYINGDTLTVGTPGSLSVDFSNGTLTLSGTASLATYNAALQSVEYGFTAGGNPTGGGSHTSRTISWSVNDGVASSAAVTSALNIVHVAPTVTTGGTVDFTGGSGAEVPLDSGVVLVDPDSNGTIVSATVTVGGYISGDTLSAGTPDGLGTSFSNGTLTLSGTASLATYQAALRSVDYTFTPTDGDPTGGGSDTSRSISWEVNDGVATGSGGSTLDEIHVAPTVVAGGSASYPEDSAPVALDPGLTVSDPDSGGDLIGATVSITSGFLSGDVLSASLEPGITATFLPAQGELTLAGSASLTEYQEVLQSVSYSYSGDPTDGGTDDSRTITWSVSDGVASSAPDNSALTVLCFCASTRIATPDGQVAVEHLAVGDRVLTAGGAVREICWIGVGRVLATRGRRNAATPVIVARHALAPNVPYCDLYITKGHSLFLEGVLIPAEFLVNHRSIRWDDRAQEVELYHIELETHDVLLANGAPAESYRDDGNRWLFQNANSGWHLAPKPPCAPVLTGGDLVDAVWRRLLEEAGPRRLPPLTNDPDLHLLADGRRIDAAERRGRAYVFYLPDCPGSVRIVSRDAVPAELGLTRDPRPLGVALRRIVACQGNRGEAHFAFIEAADPRLIEGFHSFEPSSGPWCGPVTGHRWTDGNAVLPIAALTGFAGPLDLVLHLGGTTQYVAGAKARRAA